jgi:hypothetical protein
MKVAIIHAPYSYQASTVKDSIESFSLYGQHQYTQVRLRHGELEINLHEFDALIVHYSCIAFPYKYFLPISARAAMKIAAFKGIKFALIQDEQRSGFDRLRFLNMLGINHLFSVAEPNLHELLYPSRERNFSISTVLTGYVSKQHREFATRRVPLCDRKVDISYRGRRLPSWMGKTSMLKGDIPNIIGELDGMKSYVADLSSEESSRIYSADWFEFLQRSKVSIGTPSGSDFLDLHGKFIEPWIPATSVSSECVPDPTPATYQVISPRYFDYVAAGNLVVLTPGLYSNIPVQGTYIEISETLEELPKILQFASTYQAQLMADKSKDLIISDSKLQYSFFVETIETSLGNHASLFIKPSFQNEQNIVKTNSRNLSKRRSLNLLRNFLSHTKLKDIRNHLLEIKRKIAFLRMLGVTNILQTISSLSGVGRTLVFKPRLIWELIDLIEICYSKKGLHFVALIETDQTLIKVLPNVSNIKPEISKLENSYRNTDRWFLNLDYFGTTQRGIVLRSVPAFLKGDIKLLTEWMDKINNDSSCDTLLP